MPGDRQNWGHSLATGLESAIGLAVGYYVGHWLGKRYGWDPASTLIGAAIGFIAGVYLLIKDANRLNKD